MTSLNRALLLGTALVVLAAAGCRSSRPQVPDWADHMARNTDYASAQTPTPAAPTPAAPRPARDVWVCPMHPEIKQPEPGTCPVCGMQLVRAGAASAPDKPAAHGHGPQSGSPSHSHGSSSGCAHCG